VTGNVDFFICFERARRDEHNGISHLRIRCQIKKLEGGGGIRPPLYVRVTKIDLYVRVLIFAVFVLHQHQEMSELKKFSDVQYSLYEIEPGAASTQLRVNLKFGLFSIFHTSDVIFPISVMRGYMQFKFQPKSSINTLINPRWRPAATLDLQNFAF